MTLEKMPVNDWHFYVQDERYVMVPWPFLVRLLDPDIT
jgi:hypothetical protein